MTSPTVYLIVSADTTVGKVDVSSMPHQSVMELLVQGISNRERICGSAENPSDLSKWSGVELDENRNVRSVEWANGNFSGSLAFQWLPPTIEKFWTVMNELVGQINLSLFPPSLKDINIQNNLFDGSLDLTCMPVNLEVLEAGNNKLSGNLNLTQLPEALQRLSVAHNEFTGPVCLTRLPFGMTVLNISLNSLSGTVDLTQLPPNMISLLMQRNSFSGEVDFSKLPSTMHLLHMSSTGLSGRVYVDYTYIELMKMVCGKEISSDEGFCVIADNTHVEIIKK